MRSLDGLVVLDFSTLLPGPLASLLLAEAGAEVIKVERVGTGDEMRAFPPKVGDESALFALLNRGKSSIALDLTLDADRQRLEPYLCRSDVLIEQFRPGVMDRLGLGYGQLSIRFPNLIYCSITGYGQKGPKAKVAGHDLNYIAETGLLSLSTGPTGSPIVPPALVADIAGGAYPAVMNILLALEMRRRTGLGLHLDVSMTDNMFPLAWWALAQRAVTGTAPGNADSLLNGGSPRYRLYPTSDRRIVAAAPIEQRFWENFCEVIGLERELCDDQVAPAATLARVAEIIASRTGACWQRRFSGVDCCCTLVQSLDQALADPHFRKRAIEARRTVVGVRSIPALPLPIASALLEDAPYKARAPRLGEIG